MDGVDPLGPGHFAKRTSRFDEINPRSESPLSSPPLSSSLYPLRCRAHPTARPQRRAALRGTAVRWGGRARHRGRSPSPLPLQEEARHGGGQARPARLREGRGCRVQRRAAPSFLSPTSGTGHGGDRAWPARLREVRGWAGPPVGRGHDHDGQRWEAQIPRRRLCFSHFSAPPSVTALAAAPLLAIALARTVTLGVTLGVWG